MKRFNKKLIHAGHLKGALMSYFRFQRQCIVATEVNLGGYGICDILADNGKATYDVEVKISMQDVMRDFEKHKHKYMKTFMQGLPTYCYFCIPVWLPQAVDYIIKQGDQYGIIIYDPDSTRFYRPEDYIHIIRSGKRLREGYTDHFRDKIIMRMSSELCSFYNKGSDVRDVPKEKK